MTASNVAKKQHKSHNPAMSAKKTPAAKKAVAGKTKATAKPRLPTADQCKARICDRLAEGIPLREICREAGMPAWRTVYDWMDADEAFAAAIARARDIGADAIAAESLSIVDEAPERTALGNIDPGSVAHAKLRAEHRLKLLAKWNPKKYGDKLAIGGTDDLPPVQQNVTLGPAEAYKRLIGGA